MKTSKLAKYDPRQRPAERKLIPLDKVQIDRSTQARVKKNPEHVQALVEVLEAGKEFVADIEVYHDGYVYWLADGFHRADAYAKAGRAKVWAQVREGTHRDAAIHAAGANAEHGLPRSRKDIRRAIGLLLEDEEIARLADTTIAKLARTTDKTVASVRREIGLDTGKRVYTDKHGNQTEMDVSGQRERGKVTKCFDEPVNAFHDLPDTARRVIKDLLAELSLLPKAHYSFVLTWLKQLPPSRKRRATC
jgi:hypothetical protein